MAGVGEGMAEEAMAGRERREEAEASTTPAGRTAWRASAAAKPARAAQSSAFRGTAAPANVANVHASGELDPVAAFASLIAPWRSAIVRSRRPQSVGGDGVPDGMG